MNAALCGLVSHLRHQRFNIVKQVPVELKVGGQSSTVFIEMIDFNLLLYEIEVFATADPVDNTGREFAEYIESVLPGIIESFKMHKRMTEVAG